MGWLLAALSGVLLLALAALVLLLLEQRTLRRRSETAPAERERAQRLETLLAALPAPLILFDRDGHPLEEFPAGGHTPAREMLDRMPDDAHADFLQRLRLAIDEGQRQQLRFTRAGRWLVAHIVPLPAPFHSKTAAVLFRDVTDEQESAGRLNKLAARNEAILRSAMDGFFVVGEDARFLEVNDAFCRMTGHAAEELLQMKISDLEVPQAARGPAASDSPRTGLHHFVTAYRHKDGHPIQLEISVIVLRDAGRKILVGFARDVTERNRTEERIRQVKERFETLVARMPLGYVVWTPDFRAQEWNPSSAAIFGYTAGEALGRPAQELIVPPEGREAVGRMWGRLLAGEPSNDAIVKNIRKDGEPLTCEWFNTVLYDAAGRIQCVATLVRDVSERQRLEAQLRQAQKLESLGMLAGGVAHDFNNFLVGILCNASLALEKLPQDMEVRRYLQKIVNASRRASELTRQMLAYSGGATYDIQAMDLNQLIRELTDFMRAALPKTVALATRLQADLPWIEADSGQVQQVIMNLLINAAEAIGERAGQVALTTATHSLTAKEIAAQPANQKLTPGEYVRLIVEDTGCGMSPETLARIFEPFFTTKFTGRGLGLAAIQGIVRAHRGAVRVESEPGRGTKFTVLLPAALKPSASVPASAPAAPQRLPAGSTVLLIDDEEDVRDVVQSVLENRGLRVLTAESGARGVELFRQHADEIDVVLLDMTMPGMNGAAVSQEILALRPAARIILSSGYSEQEALARFGDRRPAGFVQKPFTVDALVDKVGAVLS